MLTYHSDKKGFFQFFKLLIQKIWNQMWILSTDKCWTVMVSFVFSENKYHEMLHNKLIKLPVINPDAFLSWMFWLHWLPDVFVKDDHSNGADDQGYYRLKKYIKDWTLNLIFVFCLLSLIIKVTNFSEIRGDGGSKTPTILLLVLVNFVASIEMSTQDVKILAISQTLGKILQKQQNHLEDVALLVLQDDPIIWGSE